MSARVRVGRRRPSDNGTSSTGPKIRITHRATKGTKLYAVRDTKGRFVDIQAYKRAHAADIKRKRKAEIAAKQPKGLKKKK